MLATDKKTRAPRRGDAWRKALVRGHLYEAMRPTGFKRLRVKKGLTQEYLSVIAKVSISNMGAIERGDRPVKRSRAEQLADVLGCKLATVFAPHPKFKGKFLATR